MIKTKKLLRRVSTATPIQQTIHLPVSQTSLWSYFVGGNSYVGINTKISARYAGKIQNASAPGKPTTTHHDVVDHRFQTSSQSTPPETSTMMQPTLTLTLLALTGGLFQVTNAQNQTESIQIENDNPDFRVCGVNYTEVLGNCNANPPCPTGDRCPVGYTCYQLNEKLCPPETSAPTTEPTAAPTTLPPAPAPAFKICAEGFSQAASLCFDSTAKDCATCNNVTEACFTVAPQLCTDGNIDAPTSPQTAAPTAAPTAVPKPTATPTMSVAPTKAPTPNRFFCATNWDTVDESCSTATPCPNGQQDCASTDGMNCYQIRADECVGQTNPVDTGSSETEGSDAQWIDTPASSPSTTVSEKVKVCAKDLIEATFNCATNTPCNIQLRYEYALHLLSFVRIR